MAPMQAGNMLAPMGGGQDEAGGPSPAGNPLASGQASPLPPDAGPEQPPSPAMDDPLDAAHSHAQSQFELMAKAKQTLGRVRVELDALAKLGDMVTQEDVVKAAGNLVASGLAPKALASLLADMPPEGEALQAWVMQHDQAVRQREAQATEAHNQVRAQLGLTAMRALMGQHLTPGGQPRPPSALQ